MDIEIVEIGNYILLRANKKVDVMNIAEFKKILYDSTGGKYSHLAVELTANYYDMDSSVIGALVSGQKKMNANNGKFVLLNFSQDTKTLFTMAGLNDFFNFVDGEDQLFV